MAITVRAADASDVAEFIGWRYEPPYDEYDLALSAEEALDHFLDPATRCHVILVDGDLAGYCTFGEDARVPGGDYRAPALDIGVGIRPELTGRGHGIGLVAAVVDFAARISGMSVLRVSIAALNARAIKVWTANGFRETRRFEAENEILETTEFVVLGRELGG